MYFPLAGYIFISHNCIWPWPCKSFIDNGFLRTNLLIIVFHKLFQYSQVLVGAGAEHNFIADLGTAREPLGVAAQVLFHLLAGTFLAYVGHRPGKVLHGVLKFLALGYLGVAAGG